jgi:hypothetical protein
MSGDYQISNINITMLKNKSAVFLAGGMALAGLLAGVATIASAQTATTTASPVNTSVKTQTVDTPEPGDVADVPGVAEQATHAHSPLGGDGVVSSISGNTIIVSEESNEGGASYTVDASKASVTNNGATASLTDIEVGAKIFVQGTTSGTNVSATSISIGHRGNHIEKANDTDGGTASEAAEPAGSSDTTE